MPRHIRFEDDETNQMIEKIEREGRQWRRRQLLATVFTVVGVFVSMAAAYWFGQDLVEAREQLAECKEELETRTD